MPGHPQPGAPTWRPPVLPDDRLQAYLTRIGLDPAAERRAPRGPEQLTRLQRHHQQHVVWETLWIAAGERRGIDPAASTDRILAGVGGYCYHLNGAYSALLTSLGYTVTWHDGGVHTHPRLPAPGTDGNHLALTVDVDGEPWWVEVALGDGPTQPHPVRPALFGPQDRYRLRPSEVVPGGWRYDHEPGGAVTGMDFADAPIRPQTVQHKHERICSDPDAPFVRLVIAQHRTSTGSAVLRGRMFLTREDGVADAQRSVVGSQQEWESLLREEFGLGAHLDAMGPAAVADTWARQCAEHERWLETLDG